MASYTLRKLDDELWAAVKAKAAAQSLTITKLIEQLLRDWVDR